MANNTGLYILSAIALLLFVGGGIYFWRQTKKNKHQRHIVNVLESLGVKYLKDVVLPDGLDGLAFIDYLLLVPNGVVVLDVNHIEGHLFGGERVDQWSQVVNNKTYKFENPLYGNQKKCQAVSWNVEQILGDSGDDPGDWHTHGWITFSNAGNFPKGIPSQVSMIDDLKSNLEQVVDLGQPVTEQTRTVWDALHNLSISTRAGLSS
jgi:hypothetical protein